MKHILLFMVLISITISCKETIGNTDRTEAALTSLTSDYGMVQPTVFKTESTPFADSIKKLLEAILVVETHPAILIKKYHAKYMEYIPETEVVIQTPHRRYTLYFNYQMSELSLWIRPARTVSRAVLTNIVDMHANGSVDFAIESNTAPKLLFSSEVMFGEDKRGREHEVYWQKRYKNAVDSLITYLKVPM